MVAAAIRNHNPGAMWGKGNPIAKQWGSTGTEGLNDGLGQGNNIAYFPTNMQGACAQFALWRKGYCNMTLRNAILKWSGGNWSQPYANFLTQHTGLSMDAVVTESLLAGPSGWKLMKYQAQWEAGQPFPMTDTEWMQAQAKVFSGKPPVSVAGKKGVGTGVVVGGTVATATKAASSGVHWSVIILILLIGAVLAGVAWVLIHKHHEDTTVAKKPDTPQPVGVSSGG